MDETRMHESGWGSDARLRPAADVVARRLDDNTVLVNLRTNLIYELNHTGARLWELIVEGCDRGELERRMLQEFAVDDETLSAEVTALLDSLREAGLVTADVNA
jgi:Coenzyme PQQ synthesis protein D (PqqD)